MKTVLFGALAVTVGLGLTAAAAQDDDWEFQEDAARHITIAAARYDAGQIIVVQCRDNKLTAILGGLPQSTDTLQVQAHRADGRSTTQSWRPAGSPGAYSSVVPGRDVRFLRGGGMYTVRTVEGETPVFRGNFDLPTQSANLDRVLTACGWATTDDRDALAEATEISLTRPGDDDGPRRPQVQVRRGAPRTWERQEPDPAAPPPPVPPAEAGVSCIVRNLRLRECRPDHQASLQERGMRELARQYEGEEVYAAEGSNAAASEGKVVHLSGGRVTIIDYLRTVPSR